MVWNQASENQWEDPWVFDYKCMLCALCCICSRLPQSRLSVDTVLPAKFETGFFFSCFF